MNRDTGDVPLLKLNSPVVTADADRNMRALRIDTHRVGDALLHLVCRIEGIVSRREGRHDFVTHGLDDRAPEILGGLLHHLQALLDCLPGALVAEIFIELRAADHVCKQYRKLLFGSCGHMSPGTQYVKRLPAVYAMTCPVWPVSGPAIDGINTRPPDRPPSRHRPHPSLPA